MVKNFVNLEVSEKLSYCYAGELREGTAFVRCPLRRTARLLFIL
jgi:hypothetical protein